MVSSLPPPSLLLLLLLASFNIRLLISDLIWEFPEATSCDDDCDLAPPSHFRWASRQRKIWTVQFFFFDYYDDFISGFYFPAPFGIIFDSFFILNFKISICFVVFFFKLILIFLIICSFLKSLFLVIRMLLLPVASGNVKTDAQRRRALSLTCVSPGHSIKLDSGVEIRFHRNPRHFRLVTSGPPPEADTGNDRNSTPKHLQELSTMEDGTLPVYFRFTSGPWPEVTGTSTQKRSARDVGGWQGFTSGCSWPVPIGNDRKWPEVTGTRTPRRWWLSGVDKCPGGENAGSADRWLALGLGGAAPVTSSIPVFPLMNLFYFSIENCNRAALIVDWQLIHDFRLPRSSPLLVIGSHAPPSSFISFRFIIDLIWF